MVCGLFGSRGGASCGLGVTTGVLPLSFLSPSVVRCSSLVSGKVVCVLGMPFPIFSKNVFKNARFFFFFNRGISFIQYFFVLGGKKRVMEPSAQPPDVGALTKQLQEMLCCSEEDAAELLRSNDNDISRCAAAYFQTSPSATAPPPPLSVPAPKVDSPKLSRGNPMAPTVVCIAWTQDQMKLLNGYLHAFGLQSCAVSAPLSSPFLPLDAASFYSKLILPLDLKHTVCFVTASDAYTQLTDALNQLLDLPGLDPSTSANRRDKFLMQDVLRQKGVPHAKTFKCVSAEEAHQRVRGELGNRFPVVLKPIDGAGTEYVFSCSSHDDIDEVFAASLHAKTTQHTVIGAMAVQEQLCGREYVVDTVSYEGVHVVTDVWTSEKEAESAAMAMTDQQQQKEREKEKQPSEGGAEGNPPALASPDKPVPPQTSTHSFVYRLQKFVPFRNEAALDSDPPSVNEQEARVAADYICRVLTALDLRVLAAHCELMITEDGPKLIELNARTQGDTPRSTNLVGYDQLLLIAYVCALFYYRSCTPPVRRPTDCEPHARISDAMLDGALKGLWPPVGIPPMYVSRDPTIVRWVHFFRVKCPKAIVLNESIAFVRSLPTFVDFTRCCFKVEPRPGMVHVVAYTYNLFTSPGAVILEGTTEKLAKDRAILIEMENCTRAFIEDAKRTEDVAKLLQCIGEIGAADPPVLFFPHDVYAKLAKACQ